MYQMPSPRTSATLGLAAALVLAGLALPASSNDLEAGPSVPETRTLETYPRLQDVQLVEPGDVPPTTSAGIGPGSLLYMAGKGAECTANFVWTDGNGTRYLGTAGHCVNATSGLLGSSPKATSAYVCFEDCELYTSASSLGASTSASSSPASPASVSASHHCTIQWSDEDLQETWDDLCRGKIPGVGQVVVEGNFTRLGEFAFSRAQGVGWDFALIEIPDRLDHLVDPTMPVWGGPNGVFGCDPWTPEPDFPPWDATEELPSEPGVLQFYGHGVGFGEVWPEKARAGAFDTQFRCDWRGTSFGGVAPVSFGDSGSAVNVVHAGAGPTVTDRHALGIWTHLTPGGPVGTLATQAEAMVEDRTDLDVEVVTDASPLPG